MRHRLPIPIWDIYTAKHADDLDAADERQGQGRYSAGLQATIINRGASPTPGPVQGYFIVRHEPGGPELVLHRGRDRGADRGRRHRLITGFKTVKSNIESPIFVDSLIHPLCPDGSPGTLVDALRQR